MPLRLRNNGTIIQKNIPSTTSNERNSWIHRLSWVKRSSQKTCFNEIIIDLSIKGREDLMEER